MKRKGVTRRQWRIRETQLKWKKNRTRRVARWRVALLCFNSFAIVLCIVLLANFPERRKTVSVSITIDEPTLMVKEVRAEEQETSQEKTSLIEEFNVETISNSEVNIIGEKVESTEVSQIEETEAETESALETEEEEDVTIVEELIAEHTIDNPNSKPDRNTNLAAAADIINGETDGYILKPGEKFSWIEVVGKTTEEKGFKKAPEYQNGKLVQGIGGGICQVSTTINSTIQKTEQKTDEEYFHAEPHSITLKTGKPPAYIKPERGDKEASVASSVGKDFWFVNSLEYSIRMHIETNGGGVTVQVFKREIIPN